MKERAGNIKTWAPTVGSTNLRLATLIAICQLLEVILEQELTVILQLLPVPAIKATQADSIA